MRQELDVSRNVYVDRDDDGMVRQLRHIDAPFRSSAHTPQLAAADYLHAYGDLLDLASAALDNLGLTPADEPENVGTELRYLTEKQQLDTATVAYSQTELGLPVFEAGVAVQLTSAPFRVLSVQSTAHPGVKVKRPSAAAIKKARSLTATQLTSALGLRPREANGRRADRRALEIERKQLVVYRYESDQVQRDAPPVILHEFSSAPGDVSNKPALDNAGPPRLPLPPVPDSIREGEHYVSLKVDFALGLAGYGPLHWTAILDVETLAVVYVRAHVDSVSGLVFDVEPSTTNGGPAPSSTDAMLNPVRVSQTLLGLDAPSNGTQSLSGDTVKLVDSESPTVAAPAEPTGTNFNFDTRTDNFSAVNAYIHCDRFFRLVDSMGLARSTYFGGTTFPSSVDHPAPSTRQPDSSSTPTASARPAAQASAARHSRSPTRATRPNPSASPTTTASCCMSWPAMECCTTTSAPPTSSSRTAPATASPPSCATRAAKLRTGS